MPAVPNNIWWRAMSLLPTFKEGICAVNDLALAFVELDRQYYLKSIHFRRRPPWFSSLVVDDEDS